MIAPQVVAFIAGVIAMGYAVAGLFFLKFWARAKDGLFAAFALAFWLMALNQALPALLDIPKEEQSPFYLIRLAAFVIIILAILGKNMGRKPPG